MEEALLRSCPVCRTTLEAEDLFCPNCGRESPLPEGEVTRPPASPFGLPARRQFTCEGCGASMSYNPGVQSLHCPYCGSVKVEAKDGRALLRPHGVIPFAVDASTVQKLLRRHLTKSWLSPRDLVNEGTLVKIEPVFVPCWVFSARTLTQWTADVADVPWWAKGTWRPVYGERSGEHKAVLVPASRVLSDDEIDSLGDFDLSKAEEPEVLEDASAYVEIFTIPRKYARATAVEKIRRLEEEACRQQYLGPGNRNLNVNVTITHLSGRPFLVPVWVLAYHYRGKVFRFLVNGQTGKVVGRVPISWVKVAVIVLGILLTIVAVEALRQLAG